jgi:hypothetical protein
VSEIQALTARLESVVAQGAPEDIRELLVHIRGAARIIAKWTPTQYDDQLVTLLDFILGTGETQAQAVNVPWDQLVKLLLPLLMDLLAKWLAAQGGKSGGGLGDIIGGLIPGIQYEPATTGRCSR